MVDFIVGVFAEIADFFINFWSDNAEHWENLEAIQFPDWNRDPDFP